MHIIRSQFYLCTRLGRCAIALLVFAITAGMAQLALADFTAAGISGQVTGFDPVDNRGGGMTDAIVVGVNDLGGILGDGEQVLGGVDPLESPSAIIGQLIDGIGAVTLTDSASRWVIGSAGTGDLTIGMQGQGLLTVSTSATVDVSGNTILGASAFGLGTLEVNGTVFPGARLKTVELTVGDAGVGIVEISDRGSLVSELSFVGATASSGDGTVSLTDTGTRWSVRGELTIGGLAGLSNGKVEISNDALLQIAPADATPTVPGALTINAQGTLNLLGGTVRAFAPGAAPLTDPPNYTNITNNGIISGDGFINAEMTIGAGGLLSNALAEVQNGPTVTNFPELLRVSGEVTNDGRIESLGGRMIFDSLVTNNNVIHARDAILDFSSTPPEDAETDLLNTGLLVLGGDISITGDIDSSGGDIFTLDDTNLLLQGNLDFNSGIFGIAADSFSQPITVTGAADLSGATIDLELSSGFSPGVGVPFALLQAADGVMFPANMSDSAGGRIFNFSIVGDTLFAEDTGFATVPVGADFNGDGMVNALDIAIWENNYPIASGAPKSLGDADGDGDVDGADFMKIQRDLGVIPVPPIMAVPEPSTMALALLTLVCCPRRRRA